MWWLSGSPTGRVVTVRRGVRVSKDLFYSTLQLLTSLSLFSIAAYRNLTRVGTGAARQLCQALFCQGSPAKSQQPIIALLGPSGPGYLTQALGCWHAGAAILPIAWVFETFTVP